jgi:hypothetical protein
MCAESVFKVNGKQWLSCYEHEGVFYSAVALGVDGLFIVLFGRGVWVVESEGKCLVSVT